MITKETYFKLWDYLHSRLRVQAPAFLFECNSLEELGEEITNCIYNEIPEVSLSSLKEIFNEEGLENPQEEADNKNFYNFLAVEVLGYDKLPRSTYIQCLRRYLEIYKRYTKVIDDIDFKLGLITQQTDTLEKKREDIIAESNGESSFLKDIKTMEKELMEIFTTTKKLDTESEMLQIVKDILVQEFGDFGDKKNKSSILVELRRIALKLANQKLDVTLDQEFRRYNDAIEIAESNSKNYLKIFFKVKFYKQIMDIIKKTNLSVSDNRGSSFENYKAQIHALPTPDELIDLKSNNPDLYKMKLWSYIKENNVLNYVREQIDSTYCLDGRKSILEKIVNLFSLKDYTLFNNLMSVQIEGIFKDFLLDSSMSYRLEDLKMFENTVLREKLKNLKAIKSDVIYEEAFLYFYSYYNHLIRNPIAHGNYNDFVSIENEEEFALELLLDLNFLIYMISRESESNKINRFISRFYRINQTEGSRYGILFNELNGKRLHSDFDRILYPNAMQSVNWIINPYFEPIHQHFNQLEEVEKIRKDLYSTDFWKYVLKHIDSLVESHLFSRKVNENFIRVIKNLFPYIRLKNPQAVVLLAKVHKMLATHIK